LITKQPDLLTTKPKPSGIPSLNLNNLPAYVSSSDEEEADEAKSKPADSDTNPQRQSMTHQVY